MLNRLTNGMTLAVIIAITAFGSLMATVADAAKVHMNDGRVLEGEIVDEGEGYIFLLVQTGSVKSKQFIQMVDIKKIERDANDQTVKEDDASESDDDAKKEAAIDDGATRVAFITLEEMVGPYFNAGALERSWKALKELPENEQPDIVVLDIRSGGGALWELILLQDFIMNELQKEVRTVAWIRWAISAAAMTAWACEEIYMQPDAAIGGCTGYRSTPGGADAMDGRELEEILQRMAYVSSRANRDPLIMRAMQIQEPLSCDVDEVTGDVTWYNSEDEGEFLVNRGDEILTLHSQSAEQFGVSLGTAATRKELMKLLGCHEWVVVGEEADEIQHEFRDNVASAEKRVDELYNRYNLQLQLAGAQNNRRDRNKYIGQARKALAGMQAQVRKAPSLAIYNGLTDEWFEQQYDYLRKLANPGGI